MDFLIHNEQTKTFLAVLVHPKGESYTPDNGYFDISEFAARCLMWYFLTNFKMEKGLEVLTTNGHKWQLHSRDSSGAYRKTKPICSEAHLIYRDEEAINSVLGMIRFACGIKSEGQSTIEQLYDLYNDQIMLKDIDQTN